MADLNLTQVPGGLKIVSDNSSFIINEYSTKRNNLNVDEISIVSDIKDNYAERPSGDPSSRPLVETTTFATVSSGTDVVLGLYTVPDKVDMQSKLDSTGIPGATISEFRNTIRNKLKKVIAAGESVSNKTISLSVYLVPIADVSGASFSPINPYINVIEFSSVGTVSLANATKIVELADIRGGGQDDVRLEDFLLDGSQVGVITVTSTGNMENVRYTIITEDQF